MAASSAASASASATDAATLERQTVELLYKCPYVRKVGGASEFVDVELPREAARAAAGSRARAIVRPPPSAVTTLSFKELRRSLTRPQRYGPVEVRAVVVFFPRHHLVSGTVAECSLVLARRTSCHTLRSHPPFLLQRFSEPLTESQVVGWAAAKAPPARPFDFSAAITGHAKPVASLAK